MAALCIFSGRMHFDDSLLQKVRGPRNVRSAAQICPSPADPRVKRFSVLPSVQALSSDQMCLRRGSVPERIPQCIQCAQHHKVDYSVCSVGNVLRSWWKRVSSLSSPRELQPDARGYHVGPSRPLLYLRQDIGSSILGVMRCSQLHIVHGS
jgi:hypothetical protein